MIRKLYFSNASISFPNTLKRMPSQPDLSIAHYRHFLLVAELRSFRAAAARAFRSQPALSLSSRCSSAATATR
jgi:hypothetical protein